MKKTSVFQMPLRFKRLQTFFTIQWLYLRYLLSGESLQLYFISEPGPIISASTIFTLRWEVNGCYKINVNGIVLPGNTGFVRLDPVQLPVSLQLKFYGYRQTITKVYTILPGGVRTKQISHSIIREPKLKNKELYCQLPGITTNKLSDVRLPLMFLPGNIHINKKTGPAGIHTVLKQVQLEQCNIPPYNP